MSALRMASFLVLLLALAGCSVPSGEADADGADDVGLTGKADGTAYTQCELDEALSLINSIPASTLDDEGPIRDALKAAGVHGSAAKCIAWYRLGIDTTAECGREMPAGITAQPRSVPDAETLDAIKYVGQSAFRSLIDAVAHLCVDPPTGATADVVWSPQDNYADSHAARIVDLIDNAERSLDIAMYSFSEPGIKAAVLRNAARLRIRLLYDKGHLGGGLETDFEDAGIEVRYVGQIMHHKYCIVDGVQDAGDDPARAIVASGTANWSNGAVATYDESTIFIENSPEMALRFQREFNLLWAHSEGVEGHDEIENVQTVEITDAMIDAVDDPATDAIFTSTNFRVTSSGRLQVDKDGYDVADRWVEAIENAEHSVWLFSERLRSVPVAEALMRKIEANPDFEIRVLLDNQEFIREDGSAERVADLQDCYAGATTETQRLNCESGMYYSYEVTEAFEGAPNAELRMSYYSYNWHYSFHQFHMKSMVVDGRTIYTGSYNLSFNAEFNTFENVMIFDGQSFPELLDAFLEGFEILWTRGEEDGALEELMADVEGTRTSVPIRFSPISMTWAQVDAYRDAVYAACGGRQLYDLKQHNERAWTCARR